MASKTVILLLALVAAVLVLQVAVADAGRFSTSRLANTEVDGSDELEVRHVVTRRLGDDTGFCGAPFGKTCCRGRHVDTNTDKEHCGKCDEKCAKGVKCTRGICGYNS